MLNNNMSGHPNKEVIMAASKAIRLVLFGGIMIALVIAIAMLSCDKRSAVSPGANGTGTARVSKVLIRLSPTQIRLPSPEAIDSVSVQIAVLDSTGTGLRGITVAISRTPEIGFVMQPDTTDNRGVTEGTFVAQPGAYGQATITATAGGKIATANLIITGPSRYNLTLAYSPPVPKLIDHEAAPYVITAALVDTTQRGVGGQPVTFAILNQVGRISFEDTTVTVPFTNSQGLAEALFHNTQVDEISNPTEVIIQAVTPSPGDPFPLAASVTIPLRRVNNTLSLEAIPTSVIGDGTSSTTIRAILLDTDSHAIIDDTVRFVSVGHEGAVQAIRFTDDNGIATSTFTPYNRVNEPTVSRIAASYRDQTIHAAYDTAEVTIMPVRSIGIITVSLSKQRVVANGIDSAAIFITVQDSTGGLIADGTTIYLNHFGTGQLSVFQVQTSDGQARAKITGPSSIVGDPRVRIDSIFVSGQASDSTFITAVAVVTYDPGPLTRLQFIQPESTVFMIAGSGETYTIIVEGLDANGNPVLNGTQINFRNTLETSSITPRAVPTSDGRATTTYLVGTGIGDDNVRAWVPNPSNPNDTILTVNPAVFRCLSSQGTTIELSSSRPSIQVGGSSCQIIATLRDAYGNPLSEGYVVTFQITAAPGDSASERPSFDTQPGIYYDTTETNINGQAIVQIYSGHKSGAVSIKACTVPLPPDYLFVCDEKSLITISSGPPAWLQPLFNATGQASNPNVPERFVGCGALVGDRYNNYVEYGTAVYFSLLPDSLADIDGNSYTGGAKPYFPDDSTEGVAYSRIVYGCLATFQDIRIIASSAGDSGRIVADTSSPFTLPIYEGTISVSGDPGNLWTDNGQCTCSGGPNNNCRDTSFITATLRDGGLCPIQGGIIHFVAEVAGAIIGQSTDTTDTEGRAFTRYMIRGCEIPCGQTQCTIETTVRAWLDQKPSVSGAVNIVCSRPF
jgi:hypothetical protein